MCSAYDLNRERLLGIAGSLEDSLRPYESDAFAEGRCDSMQKLVEQAACLDADLAQSRASFRIFMRSPDEMKPRATRPKGQLLYGFDYKAEWMEDDQSRAAKRGLVELILSPTVLKFGDSDGRNYEHYLVMLRARVVCERLSPTEQWPHPAT